MDKLTRPRGVQVTFTARLKAGTKWDPDAKVWVTYAPALQIYSQGTTKARAKRAVNGAVRLFLGVAYEHGVWDRALRSIGLVPVPPGEALGPDAEFVGFHEEEILEQASFDEFFDIQAMLPLELTAA